ncbi:RGG repeats nuclear RNA binding protein A isoform X2 [Daucus carota subsp. sativus]|uniref:RGG repeats nuclear RNA binding protein A isoform X2 n=1 Tax=Daucus carota subsp. sativus TaxID=79200 RepID=UPI0007F00A79|nr:PREDICTED: translation initiation factor IF-2 isoform X2 [Daucus carota subsp. sativus]
MASANPFDLLVDDDNDDVSQLIQKLPPPVKKAPVVEAPAKAAGKLPSKPLPPAQAVRESRGDGQRGGGRAGGRGTGRGRGGAGRFGRDPADNGNSYSSNNNGFSGGYNRQPEEGDLDKSSDRRGGYGGPRGGAPRGGRRGGFSNGDAADGERPRRVYERHSGTGRGNEFSKRDGAGRGNWGTPTDDIAPVNEELVNDGEKNVDVEKQAEQEDAGDASKENPVTEPEEKEPEEMTLEEYEKVREEKRKALLALKSEERKVDLDKDFESMQLLSSKKNEEEIFVKLGSDKEKRKEAEKEEKARKALSINEFLKPAEGEKYYGPGRGRGRGRGPRGGYTGNFGNNVPAPIIEDQYQFPTLGAK